MHVEETPPKLSECFPNVNAVELIPQILVNKPHTAILHTVLRDYIDKERGSVTSIPDGHRLQHILTVKAFFLKRQQFGGAVEQRTRAPSIFLRRIWLFFFM